MPFKIFSYCLLAILISLPLSAVEYELSKKKKHRVNSQKHLVEIDMFSFVNVGESPRHEKFIPFSIKINNKTNDELTWTLHLDNSDYKNEVRQQRQMTVPGGKTLTFLFHSPRNSDPSSFNYNFSGFGCEPTRGFFNNYSDSTSAIIILPGLRKKISINEFGDLEKFNFVRSLDDIHYSWQGLSSFQEIYLTEQDWLGLTPIQQLGLKDWVLKGGDLTILDSPSSIKVMALFGTQASQGLHGLGSFRTMKVNPLLKKLKQHPGTSSYSDGNTNTITRDFIESLKKEVSTSELSLTLATIVLLAFGILVGPLNLLVFAKKRRRNLLLITTPAISIGASILFFIIILLKDGVGGSGYYSIVAWTSPLDNRTAIFQSQTFETGLLTSGQAQLPDGTYADNYRIKKQRSRIRTEKADCQTTNNTLGKGWYPNNSRRLQHISYLRTSRAKLEFIDGEAPKIRSSYKMPLHNIVIASSDGKFWKASKCSPGENVQLIPIFSQEIPSNKSIASTIMKITQNSNNGNIGRLIRKRIRLKEPFYLACAQQAGDLWIEGHSGIDWQAKQILIGGELTTATEI